MGPAGQASLSELVHDLESSFDDSQRYCEHSRDMLDKHRAGLQGMLYYQAIGHLNAMCSRLRETSAGVRGLYGDLVTMHGPVAAQGDGVMSNIIASNL